MTGPLDNRLSICPLRFRIASPKISWGGDPESFGQIDLHISLETSHYLFIIHLNHCLLKIDFSKCLLYPFFGDATFT